MKRQTRTLLFLAAAGLPLAAAPQTTPPAPPANTQAAPAPPTQYSGQSRIEQLNYDRGGTVNGFLMTDGVLVFTPPMDGTTAAPTMRKGSTVNVQGMSRQTMSGRKVVDAQSLKVGDQTIVFAMGGPGGPPPPPRRWGRGPAGPPPPPPPPAPAAAQGPESAAPAPPPPPAPPQ